MTDFTLNIPKNQGDELRRVGRVVHIALADEEMFDITMDDTLRHYSYDEEYLLKCESREKEPNSNSNKCLEIIFADVLSIRETRAGLIDEDEWCYCWDFGSYEEFKECYPKVTKNTIVKVILLQPINYDLKKLNRSKESQRNH
jgi:hypothetical protein